jgi:P27 family predicted phage terminase small subunit
MIKRSKLEKLYPDVRPEIIDYMTTVYKYLNDRFGTVKSEWTATLKLLADNLELLYQLKETIKEKGLMVKDRYDNWNKNPLFPILNNVTVQVLKCVDQLGLSPKANAKIKDGETKEESESAQDFINGLLN